MGKNLKTGKLRYVDKKKGYGFILSEYGYDLFVRKSEIQREGKGMINVGQKVEYEIEEDENGPRVINVRPC